jgi:hypothetical protein
VPDHLQAGREEDRVELGVAVAQQKPEPVNALVEFQEQVPRLLRDPCSGRMRGDSDVVDLPIGQFDEEQDVDPCRPPGHTPSGLRPGDSANTASRVIVARNRCTRPGAPSRAPANRSSGPSPTDSDGDD